MSALKIVKYSGFVVATLAVVIFSQQHNKNTAIPLPSIDNISTSQITKKEITPEHTPEYSPMFFEKDTLPCSDIQTFPNIICDAYVLSKLKSQTDADMLTGLQLVWQFYDNYKKSANIKKYLETHTQSKDFRISALSKFILENINGKQKIEKFSPTEQIVSTATESFQTLNDTSTSASLLDERPQYNAGDIQQIMSSGDTFIRLKAVEIATLQADDHSIDLLKQAVKDSDTSVRHMAVAGLSILIEQGLADPQDILNSLEENRADSDLEIAGITNELFERYQKED